MFTKVHLTCVLYATLFIIAMSHCDFPYAPSRQPQPDGNDTPVDTGTTGSGYVYKININQQVCNPSISQSPRFPGCMLWLGFSELTVNIPAGFAGYDTVTIAQHDRLGGLCFAEVGPETVQQEQ